ncbi:ABC-type branched-subunit amino acid transport system substrate-binding protein [Nocardiopsis arvandica]|uniref:ABC-type branched-subunit amino acid transport system substrate-binding protein n=1 Tax=Nocardiopsis sinuspersici TaxID=501010 RepID=A0A7Y9X7A4_9ACTN|nr:ABC transporter substrate-binding protein [Nocardiopsis sinuspersici]NYH50511.1 ABC-type branched-subunit amino acid transport system substrate-binding protein [Nocardiopsis sinuspersici]
MRPLRILASTLAVAVLLASCSNGEGSDDAATEADTMGVSDEAIVIGTHQPLTGAASPGFRHVSTGARAVFDYINDNGGIHGRRIEYQVQDDSFDPAQTLKSTRSLIEDHEIFAMLGGLGTPTHQAVIDELNEKHVPDLFVSSGALAWDQPEVYPYSYGFQVDYTREAKIQGKFISEEFPGDKVGLLYQNDDVGPSSHAGIEQYLTEEIVAWESYDPGVPELAGQVKELKDSGADVAVCYCIPAFLGLAILEATAIGYTPQWVAPSFGGDVKVITGLIGEYAKGTPAEDVPPEAFTDGLIITAFLPMVTQSDDPWTRFFLELHEKYNSGTPFTDTTVYGMVQATLFAQVLMKAGPDLTRQKLLDTLNSHEWRGPGLVPFAATEKDHSGYTGVMVVRHRAGEKPEILQEPMVTDSAGGEVLPFEMDRPSPDEVALFGNGSGG